MERQLTISLEAGRVWRRNLQTLWCSQFLVTAGLTIVVPLLPFYMEELGAVDPAANRLWSGLALAAPAVTLMIASPFWGRMGDRYGRKWMVIRALLGIAISVFLMGLATTPLQFFLFRLLQGAFGGVDDSAAAFASTQAPSAERGKAIGLLQSATAAGALLGPLLGGFLSDRWGFSSLILATSILIGGCSLCSIWTLCEAKQAGPIVPQLPPLRTTIAGLLKHRNMCAALLAGLCVQIGSYGLVVVFATYVRTLIAEPRYAASWVGALQATTWGATLLGAAWWGRRNDRMPLEHNFALAAAGCSLSIALQTAVSSAEWLFPLRIIQGFCHSALGQSVYLRVSRDAGAQQSGMHIGIANSFLTLGQILGSLAGALCTTVLSTGLVFLVMGSFFGFGAVLVWAASRLALSEAGSCMHIKENAQYDNHR